MIYPDGVEVHLHDLIWWNEGQCVGYVSEILETQKDWEKYGGEINEAGIFLSLDISRRTFDSVVFNSHHSFEEEGIKLLTDAEIAEIKEVFQKVCQFDPKAVGCSYSVKRHFHRGEGWIVTLASPDSGGESYYGISKLGIVKRLSKEETYYHE